MAPSRDALISVRSSQRWPTRRIGEKFAAFFMSVTKPDHEARRLAALHRYRILDTAKDQAFDDFTELASIICATPIALISLVDEKRQWFKSRVGLDVVETPREQAFCAHTILGGEVMIVPDATKDGRFAENPLVISQPNIRFYAGAPLIDSDGYALGSLCVIDRTPRPLTGELQRALEVLARQVMAQMGLRRVSADLASALEEIKTLHGLLPICAHCKGIRDDTGYWRSVEEYLNTAAGVDLSHCVCPACFQRHYPDAYARKQQRAT